MVALQTLRSINQSLEETNNRVSTGYRVNDAADNAAYWSIATTLRSDNNALGAVRDSLGVGSSAAKATYTGLNAAKDILDQIKSKLTTATGDVDRAKVQLEIDALLSQLRSVADQAALSGDNWLSTGSSTDFSRQIVSALSRDSSNQLVVGTIDVDITAVRLYGDGTTQFGILDKTIDLTTYTATGANAATVETAAVDFAAADDVVSFSISKNGAPAVVVSITQQTLADAGLSDTSIRSNADLRAVLTQAISDAGINGVSVDVDSSGNVSFSSLDNLTVSYAAATGTSGLDPADLGLNVDTDGDMTTSTASAGAIAVADIDISTASFAEVVGYLRVVDQALSEVTEAATQIGAVQTRIDSQLNFVKALMDAKTTAVGTLVDAEMEEESTKLKALQTQQQLAVQSLSIANANSQNILLLFRQ
jgi:flagellin